MTLEENVLAYLDGSLGEEESAELLHTLSVSPEKRALLDEHLRLTELNALGRKPFAVPAAAERELIARLPFLAESPRPVPFYAKPMALLVSSAAVLTVVGGLMWNASRTEAPQSASMSHDVSSNISHDALPNMSHDAPAATTQSGREDTKDLSAATDVKANQPIVHFLKREHAVKQHVASAVEESSVAENVIAAPVQHTPVEAAASNEPVGEISEALLKAADIPTPSVHSPRTLHEIAFGVPDRLRPFSIGASGMASGYYMPTTITGAVNSSLGMDPQLTVSYDITQWFTFGVEAGYTQFGKVTNNFQFDRSFDGTQYSQLSFATEVQRTGTYYARAALQFTVDPADDYPVHFGAAGGYAFVAGTSAPIAAVSAGITRTLSEDFSLDLDMVLSGLWSTQIDQYPTTITGVTGIAHNDTQSQAPFTSAFGLRAGIRYRP